MEHTFDWRPRFDERSRNYAIREIIETPRIRPRFWLEGVTLDQGAEGACVGFGWTANALARPERPAPQPQPTEANLYARSIYKDAQKIDEWPGENYEGTSVLAGAKVMKSRNHVGEYRWCFGIEDVRDTIITTGPVTIGVPWHESMYDTDENYLVNVGGRQVGGHCITLTGYHPRAYIGGKRREVFRWRNSWGTTYGRKGSAYIEHDVLAGLLKNGEACVPTGKPVRVL